MEGGVLRLNVTERRGVTASVTSRYTGGECQNDDFPFRIILNCPNVYFDCFSLRHRKLKSLNTKLFVQKRKNVRICTQINLRDLWSKEGLEYLSANHFSGFKTTFGRDFGRVVDMSLELKSVCYSLAVSKLQRPSFMGAGGQKVPSRPNSF